MSQKVIRKFDQTYLENLLSKDQALLINAPDKLNANILIEFECNCNKIVKKLFKDISYYGGAFCKECCIKNKALKIKDTCMKRYGVINPSCSQEVKDKKEKTYMDHYGMHPRKTEEVKEKYKKTCMERYNKDNTAKVKEVIDKIKDTFLEKYGGHPMHDQVVKDKVKNTCLERYGGYPVECEIVKNKMKSTMIERYGCEYPSQSNEVMEKMQHTGKKYKKYTLPSGEIRNIQGYEHFAIDILLKEYTEEQIKTNRKDIPRISYVYNDLERYYFPDIYMPHINLIIEVKSTWTYKKDKDKNISKQNATIKAGYQYEIWMFDRKGNLIPIVNEIILDETPLSSESKLI